MKKEEVLEKYTNQKVSIEQIETIINSARLAPSFAYDDLMKFINSDGQLIGAVTGGYSNESPNQRPRKPLQDILEYR